MDSPIQHPGMYLEIPILDQEYETNRSKTKGIPKMDTFVPSNRYLRGGDPKHEIVSHVNSTIRSDGTGQNRSLDFNSANSLNNILDVNKQVTGGDFSKQVTKQDLRRQSIKSEPSWGVISNRYETNQPISDQDSINLWDHTKRGDDVFKKSPCILKMEKCPFAPIHVVGRPPSGSVSGKIEAILPMIDESVELGANSLNDSFNYSS